MPVFSGFWRHFYVVDSGPLGGVEASVKRVIDRVGIGTNNIKQTFADGTLKG